MVLLSQNNVLRVKELVSVALKHNRSINYIVDKVGLAINKVNRARPSEEDRDLSLVVLKLGGPNLSVPCKANKLPSTSLAYRKAKDLRSLDPPVTATAAECVRNNLNVDSFASSYATSLKMDSSSSNSSLSS